MSKIAKQFCRKISFMFSLIVMIMIVIAMTPSDSSALIGTKEGDVPRDITLKSLDGKEVNISDQFGKKPVILVFWELTTNRAFLNYSLEELIFLRDFHDKYHDSKGLEIFALYTPEEEKETSVGEIESVRNLIVANGINFPVLVDDGFKYFREYGVIALPSTLMISKEGIIEFIYPSFPVTARQVFTNQIEKLLGVAKAVPDRETVLRDLETRSKRLYNYSLQMYKRGFFKQAVSPLRKSIELSPNDSVSHNLMGILQWKKGDFNSSLNEFKSSIQLNKNNSNAHFNYGLLLLEKKKYDEAEKFINTSINLNENRAEPHLALGLLYKNTQKTEKALKELERFLVLFEDRKTSLLLSNNSVYKRILAMFALSQLYIDSGESEKALDVLQNAVQLTIGTDINQIYRTKDIMIHE